MGPIGCRHRDDHGGGGLCGRCYLGERADRGGRAQVDHVIATASENVGCHRHRERVGVAGGCADDHGLASPPGPRESMSQSTERSDRHGCGAVFVGDGELPIDPGIPDARQSRADDLEIDVLSGVAGRHCGLAHRPRPLQV